MNVCVVYKVTNYFLISFNIYEIIGAHLVYNEQSNEATAVVSLDNSRRRQLLSSILCNEYFFTIILLYRVG